MQISQKMENCDWIINNRNILEPIGCCWREADGRLEVYEWNICWRTKPILVLSREKITLKNLKSKAK